MRYDATTGEPVTEVEWRVAEHDGQTLLSLINYSKQRTSTSRSTGSVHVPVTLTCAQTGEPPDLRPTVIIRDQDSGVPLTRAAAQAR